MVEQATVQVSQDNQPQDSKPEEIKQEVKVNEESPKDDKLTEQFHRLSKQEAHTREQRKQLEEARKAFESERSLAEEMKIIKALRSSDPVAVLEKLGLTVDELNKALNARNQPSDPISARLKQLEEELQSEKKQKKASEEVANREQMHRAEVALNAEIDKVIKEKDYDLIPALGMQKEVLSFMEEIYESTGEVPSVDEACKAVTDHIVGLYQTASKSKWVQPKVEEPKVEEPKEVSSKSITNKMAQSMDIKRSEKPATDADRLKAAIHAMEATKSK